MKVIANKEMKITITESTIVKPAKDTPKNVLWVSNLDLLVPRAHVKTVYFYKPNGSPNFFDAQVLKKALANVLVPFYPMAGRLGRDENGRIEVHCNAEGVLFLEAETNSSMDEFGDFSPRLETLELVPKVDQFMDIATYPLLMLQVTRFGCGSVCLGVAFHHTLADGTSAIHIINSWCNIARGLSITIPPFIDRTSLKPKVPLMPTFHHSEYDPPPPLIALTDTQILRSDTTTTKLFRITLDQINALKSKSQENNPGSRPTTYETLAAHIWCCMCIARDLADDQLTRLYTATDGRLRLIPQLPLGFFGNVLFTTTVTCSSYQIRSSHLSKIIEKIHVALKQMDDQYLRSALNFLEEQQDLTALMRGAHTFKCPNLNIISWMRLPIHDADFGWGRPIFMGPAEVAFEGTAYILASPIADGSLSLILRLEAHHMPLFEKCLYGF